MTFEEEMEANGGWLYLSPDDDFSDEAGLLDCPYCGRIKPISRGFKYPSIFRYPAEGYRCFLVCPECDEILEEY